MKRCPECRRDYTDETLNYCLDDGSALVEGPSSGDSHTEILSHLPSEAATKHQLSADEDISTESSFSSKEFVLSAIRTNKFGAFIVGAILLVVTGGFIYGIYSLVKDRGGNARQGSTEVKIQPILASGNVREAVISPDGKF